MWVACLRFAFLPPDAVFGELIGFKGAGISKAAGAAGREALTGKSSLRLFPCRGLPLQCGLEDAERKVCYLPSSSMSNFKNKCTWVNMETIKVSSVEGEVEIRPLTVIIGTGSSSFPLGFTYAA